MPWCSTKTLHFGFLNAWDNDMDNDGLCGCTLTNGTTTYIDEEQLQKCDKKI